MAKHAKGDDSPSLKTIILICIFPVILGMGGVSILANYLMAHDSALRRVDDHIIQRRMDLNYIAQLPTLSLFIMDLRLGLKEEAAFFLKDTETYVADYLNSLSPTFPHTLSVYSLSGEELLRIEDGKVRPIQDSRTALDNLQELDALVPGKVMPLPAHPVSIQPDQRIQDRMPLYNEINKQFIGAIVYDYGIPVENLFSPVKENLAINAILALVTVAIALSVTYWVLEKNIRPLRDMTELVQDITDGDLTHPVALKGSGELMILATSFEAMRRQIQQQIELLTNNAAELSASLTANQRSQEQLKSERDYSAGIINDSPNLVCGIDLSGAVTSINPAGTDMTGYSAGELLGKNFFDLLLPEGSDPFIDRVLKSVDGQRLYNIECDLETRHGNRRTLLWSSVLRKDPNTDIIEVILIGNDISERKKVVNELHKFRTISDRSNYGCAIYDTEGYLTYVNDAYAAMHGYFPGDLVGQHQSVFFGDRNMEERERLNQMLLENGYLNAEETTHVNKKGGTLPVLINSTLVKDEKGSPLFFSENAIDISEKKLLEDQLQIRQRMDSLGTLAGGIAHDFNNLLSGISGYLQLFTLRSENFTERQLYYLKELTSAVGRATELIHQFQTLSRGSISKRQHIDLHDVADEVFNMLAKTTDRLIQKLNDIPSGKHFIRGNQTELSQVLLNLGVNATEAIEIKGIGPNDTIRAYAEPATLKADKAKGLKDGTYIHMTFTDTGCGMTQSIQKQAFDPLFSSKKKGQRRGQGLGLAMVYNIIKNHNGHVTIDSAPGEGTTFHIYLPAVDRPAGKKISDTEMLPGNETILFVDDEPYIRDVVRELLENIGYKILTAEDGVEGLDMYQRHQEKIDVVITDLIMPRLSGEMLFENIMRINPRERVIILSGQSQGNIPEDIRKKAIGIIAKPPDMARLTVLIRRALAAHNR